MQVECEQGTSRRLPGTSWVVPASAHPANTHAQLSPLDHSAPPRRAPPRQAVYTALKETETRATDLLPYWKYPLINLFVPRQRKAAAAVELIRWVAAGEGPCGGGGGGGEQWLAGAGKDAMPACLFASLRIFVA